MRTDALIARLSADAKPIRRLSAPGLRALVWLAAAGLVIALVTVIEGLRPDLAERLRDPWFVISRSAAVLTAIAGAVATFELSLPDRSPRWLLLPLPSAVVWLSCLGQGCLAEWLAGSADALRGPAAGCFFTILATSLPLGALLFAMVKHAGFVRPVATALTGGLALAAAAEAGLTLHHSAEIGLTDLLGHLLGVGIVVALATAAARPIFRALGARLPVFR